MKSVFTYLATALICISVLSSCKKTELEGLNLKGKDSQTARVSESEVIGEDVMEMEKNHDGDLMSSDQNEHANSPLLNSNLGNGTFGTSGGDDGGSTGNDIGSGDSGVVGGDENEGDDDQDNVIGGDENEGDDDDEVVSAGVIGGGNSGSENPNPKGGK